MTNTSGSLTELPLLRLDVCEEGSRARPDSLVCHIGREIVIDTATLETYCFSNWEPVLFDALVVSAAVQFCDRIKRRPAHGWGRRFDIRVPVHDLDRWNGEVVKGLIDALSLLTGDAWDISFCARRIPACKPRQWNIELPDPSSAVIPFSDGLDSLIASALFEYHHRRNLIRVRLSPSSEKSRNAPRERQPFAKVPYVLKNRRGGHRYYESSARSRGFTFTMLAGVAAYLAKSSEIIVPESGQGALGPVLIPVGHAYEDYRNHPRFTSQMGHLLTALLGHRIQFSFPRIWHTKGETLREFIDLFGDSWSTTRSCWQQSRQVSVNHSLRQCGICAACMLRRLSVHAAGETEPAETYVWETLSANRFEDGIAPGFVKVTKSLREYAIAGTLHLQHLAELPGSPRHMNSVVRSAEQLAVLMDIPINESKSKLHRMLNRHASEWDRFIESLGADSFVARWSSLEERR